MSQAVITGTELLATTSVVTLGARRLGQHPVPHLDWRELQFPADLSAEPVEAVLRHVAGMRRGPMVFVARAAEDQVRFLTAGPCSVLTSMTAAAEGLLPEVRFGETDGDAVGIEDETAATTVGLSVGWHGAWPVLATPSRS